MQLSVIFITLFGLPLESLLTKELWEMGIKCCYQVLYSVITIIFYAGDHLRVCFS